MTEGNYELGARVGLGIKMAHEAAVKLANTHEEYQGILGTLAEPTVDLVIEIQAKFLAQAAFPGAQVLPQAPSEPFPMERSTVPAQGGFNPGPAQVVGGQQTYAQPPAQQYPQAQPAPIPNRSSGGDWKAQKAEANWQTFFQDTTAWEDLRGPKNLGQIKPGNPDWRHRTLKDGDYKIGVWLKDAPAWAIERLRSMGVQV